MLSYHEKLDRDNITKLRFLLEELPAYCKDFFRGIEPRTQSRTRIAYAYDLKIFFMYLYESNPELKNNYPSHIHIPLSILNKLKLTDFEEYMEYLKYRQSDDRELLNKENAIKRKISSLKSFFKYFYNTEKLEQNVLSKLELPLIHEKEIVRLDSDEVADMLRSIENAENMTAKQKAFHKKTKSRDLAIISLMLGTGIRVSECVGINISDIDMKNHAIRIHRKGGKEVNIYFSDELAINLAQYLDVRKALIASDEHEDALFLSIQNKRITVRSMENLVKKYAKSCVPLKKITPHKLRSTYGTNLYKETGDIYLVADVLGHRDVNTTKKHYAALEDERRKKARNIVRLKKEEA